MRVVITGASGFIGLPLSIKLSKLGCEVLGLARSIPLVSHSSISWIKSDLSSIETYRNDIISFGCPFEGYDFRSSNIECFLFCFHINKVNSFTIGYG